MKKILTAISQLLKKTKFNYQTLLNSFIWLLSKDIHRYLYDVFVCYKIGFYIYYYFNLFVIVFKGNTSI